MARRPNSAIQGSCTGYSRAAARLCPASDDSLVAHDGSLKLRLPRALLDPTINLCLRRFQTQCIQNASGDVSAQAIRMRRRDEQNERLPSQELEGTDWHEWFLHHVNLLRPIESVVVRVRWAEASRVALDLFMSLRVTRRRHRGTWRVGTPSRLSAICARSRPHPEYNRRWRRFRDDYLL